MRFGFANCFSSHRELAGSAPAKLSFLGTRQFVRKGVDHENAAPKLLLGWSPRLDAMSDVSV